jgi:hypothetical protein
MASCAPPSRPSSSSPFPSAWPSVLLKDTRIGQHIAKDSILNNVDDDLDTCGVGSFGQVGLLKGRRGQRREQEGAGGTSNKLRRVGAYIEWTRLNIQLLELLQDEGGGILVALVVASVVGEGGLLERYSVSLERRDVSSKTTHAKRRPWQLLLEEIDLVEEEHERRLGEPPGVGDGLEHGEGFRHATLSFCMSRERSAIARRTAREKENEPSS